jgi:hypothetical protein
LKAHSGKSRQNARSKRVSILAQEKWNCISTSPALQDSDFAPKLPIRQKLPQGTKGSGKMLVEDQRYVHEDLERLEQGIADRMGDEPKHVSFTCATLSTRTLNSVMLILRPDTRSP